jgi:hypothetical protein
MLLLNFSHPLTPTQRRQIEALTGREIARLVEIMPRFDEQQPFGPQVQIEAPAANSITTAAITRPCSPPHALPHH